MFNLFFAVVLFTMLASTLTLSVVAGRRFGVWHLNHEAKHKVEVVTVAEGAVFALLGLLIAFTFTGAYDKFEARAKMIGEEASAIKTAYLRVEMLPAEDQGPLHQLFRDYLDSRLALFKHLPHYDAVNAEWRRSEYLQEAIWNLSLRDSQTSRDEATTELLLPALNTMFGVASERMEMTHNHPPSAVFALLIGLALASGFLAGYTTADKRTRNSIHILSYVVITSITLYIIIDMDFPRIGLIREDKYDQVLMDLREYMNAPTQKAM